jgi:hypothetical protein
MRKVNVVALVMVRIRLYGTYAMGWNGKPLLVKEREIPKNGQPDAHAV